MVALARWKGGEMITKEEFVNTIKNSGYIEVEKDIFDNCNLPTHRIVLDGDMIKFYRNGVEVEYLRRLLQNLCWVSVDWKGNISHR